MGRKNSEIQNFHFLEEEAFCKLQEDLPTEWIVHEEQNDPHTTVIIEFVENGQSIGKKIIAQIRGEAKVKIRNNSIVYRIQVDELEALEDYEIPALLIVHSPQLNKRVWIWVHYYVTRELNNINPQWREQKTVTLYLPVNHSIVSNIPKLREIILNGMKLLAPQYRYRYIALGELKMDKMALKDLVR